MMQARATMKAEGKPERPSQVGSDMANFLMQKAMFSEALHQPAAAKQRAASAASSAARLPVHLPACTDGAGQRRIRAAVCTGAAFH